MSEVIANATVQFAALGPDAVSMREIAAASGVNHALIHRYFRSKEDLLRAVLAQAADRLTAVVHELPALRGEMALLFAAATALDREWRMLAHALLSGRAPDEIRGRSYPVARHLLRMLRAERDRRADIDPRVAVAAIQAFVAGWAVFEGHALAGVGLAPSLRARQQAAILLEAIVDRALDAPPRARRKRPRA
jgi:AcrR family transcriptional regulator